MVDSTVSGRLGNPGTSRDRLWQYWTLLAGSPFMMTETFDAEEQPGALKSVTCLRVTDSRISTSHNRFRTRGYLLSYPCGCSRLSDCARNYVRNVIILEVVTGMNNFWTKISGHRNRSSFCRNAMLYGLAYYTSLPSMAAIHGFAPPCPVNQR